MPTSPFLHMVSTAAPRGDDHPKFLATLQALMPALSARAARLSRGDDFLRDELESAASRAIAEAVEQFDLARGVPLKPYVMQHACRRMTDALREERSARRDWSTDNSEAFGAAAAPHDEMLSPDPGALEKMMGAEYDIAIGRFLKTLPARQAEVASALLVRGFSQADVAREDRVSRTAVSKTVRKLRASVRSSEALRVYIPAA